MVVWISRNPSTSTWHPITTRCTSRATYRNGVCSIRRKAAGWTKPQGWELTGGWISNDEKYEGETQTDGQRWLPAAQHAGQHGDAWRTTVKYTRVSDAEYVRDLENHRLSAQRQTALQQLGRVEWLGESWQVRLDVEQFQSLAQDIRNDYKKLPQMTARWRGQASWLGVEPLFLAQLSHFDTDAARVTGQRLYTEAGLTLPKRWQAGFLTSTLKYRSVSYELDDFPLLDDTSPSAGSIMAVWTRLDFRSPDPARWHGDDANLSRGLLFCIRSLRTKQGILILTALS